MTTKPDHLGIEYDAARWQPLWTQGDVNFVSDDGFDRIVINGVEVGTLERRMPYCDRGRWMFRCDLPDLDGADSFPRYYMLTGPMQLEIIAWLNWRLWRRDLS